MKKPHRTKKWPRWADWGITSLFAVGMIGLTGMDYPPKVVLLAWTIAASLTGLLFAVLFNAGWIWNFVRRRILQREEGTDHPVVIPKPEVRK